MVTIIIVPSIRNEVSAELALSIYWMHTCINLVDIDSL